MADPAHYLVDGILPRNQVHILAGSSGAGKTTLMLQMIRDALDGKPWFGHKVRPGLRIGFVITDRARQDYAEKFLSMKIEPFPMVSLLEDPAYLPSGPQANPRYWINLAWERCGKPDLLCVDTLSPFLSAKLLDYASVASALVHLSRFAIHADTTIWGSHHASKPRSDSSYLRPQDRILGSAALQGYSGTQMILDGPEEVPKQPGYSQLTLNPHNAPPETHPLSRDAETGRFKEWVGANEWVEDQKLMGLIKDTPTHLSEFLQTACDLLEVHVKTIQRKLDRLVTDGFLIRPKKGVYIRPKRQ